jgi:hypothetical protein
MEKNQKEMTWDDIKAMNAETAKLLKEDRKQSRIDRKQSKEEWKKRNEEWKKRNEEWEKLNEVRKKADEEWERTREEFRKDHLVWMDKMDRLDKQFTQTREQIGGIARSNGEFCEEYFINSFKENPTLFGERFDRVLEYHRPDSVVIEDEYDLVLRNGTTIALIEMKYKAGINDVGKMFSKLTSYRANYPIYKDYKIYLCLASFRFPKAIRERAADNGVVLIQQRGDKIEVISKNIRTW